MLNTAEDQISTLLGGAMADLDIPASLNAVAVERYEDAGHWLADHGDSLGGAAWDVYPQGSFRLGTVIRPINAGDEYDIDLVCRRDVLKTSVTQKQLTADVGKALAAYQSARSDGPDELEPGKRCWTLTYTGRFHMDVLPAIPDPDGGPESTAILLSDRTMHEWQPSNPVAYANWFKDQMAVEFLSKRAALALERRSTVDAVPEWEVKTTLQRTVQVLKRHRDIYFARAEAPRPPSILITTLAARAYGGDQDLYASVLRVADAMGSLIEERADGLWVPNPVHETENFAERWRCDAGCLAALRTWTAAVVSDLSEARSSFGLHVTADRLSKSFGDGPVRTAAAQMGAEYRTEREHGNLKAAAGTAMLGTAAGRTVRSHGFFGEEA